jgi:hypothetical protein
MRALITFSHTHAVLFSAMFLIVGGWSCGAP